MDNLEQLIQQGDTSTWDPQNWNWSSEQIQGKPKFQGFQAQKRQKQQGAQHVSFPQNQPCHFDQNLQVQNQCSMHGLPNQFISPEGLTNCNYTAQSSESFFNDISNASLEELFKEVSPQMNKETNNNNNNINNKNDASIEQKLSEAIKSPRATSALIQQKNPTDKSCSFKHKTALEVQNEYDDDSQDEGSIDLNNPSENKCRVPGCNRCLKNLKEYNIKYRICDVHIKLPQVLVRGKLQRFCQQCSRFHELSAFDGNRRSCRVQLSKHNERRRKYRQKDQAPDSVQPELDNIGHQSSIKGLVQSLIENPQDLQALRVLLGVQPSLAQPNQNMGSIQSNNPEPSINEPNPPSQVFNSISNNEDLDKLDEFQINDNGIENYDNQQQNLHQKRYEQKCEQEKIQALGQPTADQNIGVREQDQSLKKLYGQLETKYSTHPPGKSIEIAQKMLQLDNTDYQSDECFIKVSVKLFGKTPDDLPAELKDRFVDWLGSMPSSIVSYIKPGCVQLTVDFKVSSQVRLHFKKMGALLFFQKFTKDMRCLLQRGTSLIQFDEELALVNNGKLQKIWSNDLAEFNCSRVQPVALKLASIKAIRPQSVYVSESNIRQTTTDYEVPNDTSNFQNYQPSHCCGANYTEEAQNSIQNFYSLGSKRCEVNYGSQQCCTFQPMDETDSIIVDVDIDTASDFRDVNFRYKGQYLPYQKLEAVHAEQQNEASIKYRVDISSVTPPGLIHIECVRGCYTSKSHQLLVSNGKFFAEDCNRVCEIYHQKKLGHVLNDFMIDAYTFLKFLQKGLVKLKQVREFMTRNKQPSIYSDKMGQKYVQTQRQSQKFFMESYLRMQKMGPMITRLINTFCDCGCHNGVIQILDFMVNITRLSGEKIIKLIKGQERGQISLLHRAVRSISPILVRRLHEWGVSNNFEFKVDSYGPFGITPLHLSMMLPSEQELAVIEITAILLNLWSSMNTQTTKLTTAQVAAEDGITPYQMALQMGTCRLDEILKALVECIGIDCKEKFHYHELDTCLCQSPQYPTVVSVIPQCALCANIPSSRQICNGIVCLSKQEFSLYGQSGGSLKTQDAQRPTANSFDSEYLQKVMTQQAITSNMNFTCANHKLQQQRGKQSLLPKYRRVFHVDTLCSDCFSGNHLVVAV